MTAAAPVFGLTKDYNAFLHAHLWDDQNGMPLSILSAFARLDVDPWQEAAALAALPSDTAGERLRALLARLPGRPDAPVDLQAICLRSTGLLPVRSSRPPVQALSGRVDARLLLFIVSMIVLGGLGWMTFLAARS